MTQTTALIVNAALALGLVAALVSVIRLAHRREDSAGEETLHPSRPLTLAILGVDDAEDDELARVA